MNDSLTTRQEQSQKDSPNEAVVNEIDCSALSQRVAGLLKPKLLTFIVAYSIDKLHGPLIESGVMLRIFGRKVSLCESVELSQRLE
jgi:hypothetical protein